VLDTASACRRSQNPSEVPMLTGISAGTDNNGPADAAA